MNQVERIINVTIAQRDLAHDQKTLSNFGFACRAASRIIKSKKSTEVEVADAQAVLNDLVPRLEIIKDRIAQTKRYISDLDHQAAGDALVRTITGSFSKAEIVIIYERDNGKKISYTRHVERKRGEWVGRSTLTNSLVVYRLPGESAKQAEAA